MRWRPTSPAEATAAEKGLLDLVKDKLLVRDVPVGPGKQDYLHTIEGGKADAPPLVMMPGYGTGAGFWFRNFPSLAQHFRFLAVDWLGTGMSGRPKFQARDRKETEAWFLDSLEAWRQREGLGKVILLGHSLGGYLAASYALRHPEAVQHLVLVCPAGIPRKPDDWDASRLVGSGFVRRNLFKMAMAGWEAGITPASFIRLMGPWGPRMVDGYVMNRFRHQGEGLSPEEANAFRQYFYHIAAAPGSGEFALRHLLSPGAWAHAPMEERLRELKVPVTFIYGEKDWMNPQYAQRLVQQLDTWRSRQVPSDHVVEVIPDAGHFVFMEQAAMFEAALLRTCAPYLRPGEAAEAAASGARDGSFRVGAEEGEQQQPAGAGDQSGGVGQPAVAP